MSRRSPNTRPPSSHSTSHSSPLISVSTITYIASWRGQLLICTIVLVVGAIYFVLHQPVADYMRRRREKISRERQQELMSLESKKEVLESPTVEKDKLKDRGREKKKEKDLRKRKGSLLKVSNTGIGSGSGNESSMSMAGPSSMESSPAPARLGVPTSAKKTRSRSRSPSPTPSPLTTPISLPARLPPSTPENRRASATTPRIRLREPVSDSKVAISEDLDVEETPKSIKSIKTNKDRSTADAGMGLSISRVGAGPAYTRSALSPEQIPLPESPTAGPSRLRVSSEAGDFSDSTSSASELPSASRPQTRLKSEGWSIMPEEGWLPPPTPVPSSKKKKNKKARQSHTDPTSALPPTQRTPAESSVEPLRQHARQDSLEIQRPANASPEEYEAHMDRMEVIIDRLRGELGASLANGRMAREAEEEARQNEEQMRTELSALRHRTRSSDKIRSREAELSNHLDQARKHSANLMQRVAELEKQIPKNGVPPPSPFMLMGPPSPFPQMNGHGGYPGNMSPMMPGSPFGMDFPSPGMPGMAGPSRGDVPHPQMYPSPLLHPNAHAHLLNAANGNMNMLNGNGNGLHLQNTPPYRRTSTSDTSNDVFAGPLTPGIHSASPSPYPYELGHGLPSGNMPRPMSTSMGGPGPIDETEAITREERRTSIEASVLRKKSGHLLSPPDGQEGPEVIEEEKQGEVVGLGMGDVLAPEPDSTQEQDQQHDSTANEEEQEHTGDGDESLEDELQSSLSPPRHFGNSTSGSGSNFTSNPPTPSPQSRLLTPSQLHNVTLAEDMGASRSGSSTYDHENRNKGGNHSDIYPSESVSVHEGLSTRQGSPVDHLWTSDLTDDQLAQRKHLAMMRAASEAKSKAREDKAKEIDVKTDTKVQGEEKRETATEA